MSPRFYDIADFLVRMVFLIFYNLRYKANAFQNIIYHLQEEFTMSNLMLDVIKDEVSEARDNKNSTPHFLAGIIMQENMVASIEGNLCIYDSAHNYWKTLKSDNYDKTIRLLIPKEYRAKCNSSAVNEILRWMDTYAEEINLKKSAKEMSGLILVTVVLMF